MAIPRFTLNEWLEQHREQFITFTIEEVAEIALASGYSQMDVDALLTRDRRFL